MKELTDNDWDEAREHLLTAHHAYSTISEGRFALVLTIIPLMERFEKGERTEELYDSITEVPL